MRPDHIEHVKAPREAATTSTSSECKCCNQPLFKRKEAYPEIGFSEFTDMKYQRRVCPFHENQTRF